MKNLIFSFIFTFLGIYSYGQSTTVQRSNSGDALSGYQNFNSRTGTWVRNGVNETSKVKGSVYLFQNWDNSGSVKAADGKVYNIKHLNYDAKLDQLVAKISSDSIFAFNGGNVKSATINNKNFKRYLDPDFGRNSFYEVVANVGDTELLKRNVIKLQSGAVNPLTHQKQIPDAYVLDEKFFANKNGKLVAFKLSKKGVVGLFGPHEEEIKKYIKDNHLNVKDYNDLKQTLTYGNTL